MESEALQVVKSEVMDINAADSEYLINPEQIFIISEHGMKDDDDIFVPGRRDQSKESVAHLDPLIEKGDLVANIKTEVLESLWVKEEHENQSSEENSILGGLSIKQEVSEPTTESSLGSCVTTDQELFYASVKAEPSNYVEESEDISAISTTLDENECSEGEDSRNEPDQSPTFTNLKNYSCNVCDKSYTQQRSLKSHMQMHAGVKFVCVVCDCKFAHSRTLKSHLLMHSGVQFSCEVCDRKFLHRSTLKSHMTTHSGIRNYSCDICDWKFVGRHHLKRHILTHSGEKNFLCEVCDRKFSDSNTLKRHMLTHSGIKQFACEVCDGKFSLRSSLKSHMLTHTGIKRFSCDILQD